MISCRCYQNLLQSATRLTGPSLRRLAGVEVPCFRINKVARCDVDVVATGWVQHVAGWAGAVRLLCLPLAQRLLPECLLLVKQRPLLLHGNLLQRHRVHA